MAIHSSAYLRRRDAEPNVDSDVADYPATPKHSPIVQEALSSKKLLVVIVPAYNEEEKIAETVRTVKSLRSQLMTFDIDLKVLVVDDGSTDSTKSRAIEAGADVVIGHNTNQGLGAAVRTGLRAARDSNADLVVKFDGDLQHNPNDIAALIAPILTSQSNVVYGSRQLDYRMPLIRKLGNKFFTALMRRLTGYPVADSQPGIFAVDKTFLKDFILPGNYNYTQQILLDASHRDLRFAQVPVRFKRRETGSSFVSIKYPFVVLMQILLIILTFRPLYVFGTIGVCFLGLAATVFGVEGVMWILGQTPKPVIHVNLVLGASSFGMNVLFLGLVAQLIIIGQRYR